MGKKKKEKQKKKESKNRYFDKVNVVFKNPIRADIIQELSNESQRPIDLADNINVPKQKLNYHLNELKKQGLVQTKQEILPTMGDIDGRISNLRGARINGIDHEGNIKITQGVELTKNGKDIANLFVNKLYDSIVDTPVTGKEIEKKKKKTKEE